MQEFTENISILNIKSNYDLIERFINNINVFCNRKDLDKDFILTIKEKLAPIEEKFEEIKTLISLPPIEENIVNLKQAISSITLREIWSIDDLVKDKINKINEENTLTEEKIIKFIKKTVSDIKQKVTEEIEKIELENKSLDETNQNLLDNIEVTKENQKEVEETPSTCFLVKRENPIRRFMRIMTEKPELWTEVEDGDRIVLRNNNGEIRGIIPKESENKKEAIVETEKAIIKAKKKYSIFQKLKNLSKSEVFSIEPEIKEQKISSNSLNISLYEAKIESNNKRINDNLNRIETITNLYQNFIEDTGDILEDNLDKSNLEIIGKLIDKIENFESMLKIYINNEINI